MERSRVHGAIEAVWRIESAKLIAVLVRLVGDVGLAEDLAQDALLTALAKWPESGIPDNPGAWLMATAKRRAITGDGTDWARIVTLYDRLLEVAPSPVVQLNRAVAAGMAFGPATGLELVEALADEPSLQDYHLLQSVRGDLLVKLGRHDEAREEFRRAALLTRNVREREMLERSAVAG